MSLKVFPHYPQQESADCGLSCLRMVTKYYGKAYSAEILRKRCFISKEGVSMLGNYLLTTISDSYPKGQHGRTCSEVLPLSLSFENLCRRIS